MRIITGTCRGRKLVTLAGDHTRPTSDMVKEAVFSILMPRIENARFLDLFAGSGQMGLEALSRGALSAVFCENYRPALEIVRKNVELCKMEDKSRLVQNDALSFLRSCKKGSFDIIYIDPPYSSDLVKKSLEAIFMFDILSENGIIICEYDTALPPEGIRDVTAPYMMGRDYKHGKKSLTSILRGEG